MDYLYIIIPLIVLLATQALKLMTDGIAGNFSFSGMFISYGGMPSAHTSFAVSITTLIGLHYGVHTALFGLSLVYTILIMRDAMTFRKVLGEQGKAINSLVGNLSKAKQAGFPRFRERVGHSWLEVLVGAVWGSCLTYIIYYFVSIT